MARMKIGEVARRAGVTVDTVRFYERRGVLPPPARLPSGYRIYDDAVLSRLRVIKGLQALGLRLDEIKEIVDAIDRGTATCANTRPRFRPVYQRIDQEIAALRTLRQRLEAAEAACLGGSCVLETAFTA